MKKSTNRTKINRSNSKNSDAPDINWIKSYTDFMHQNGLVELDIKNSNFELRLRRAGGNGHNVSDLPSGILNTQGQATAISIQPPTHTTQIKKHYVVTSPFVGTFYRAAGPNQDAFVEEGKTVSTGDALCIIEAMKLMNEIESDVKGRVVKILVNNGTPVEFGEPLFEIDLL